MVWTYIGPQDVRHPRPSQWRRTGQRCVTEQEAADPEPVPVLGLREFRRLPLPAGVMNLQPAEGPLLVNMPMNAYVGARQLVLRTRLLGVDVEVEATPIEFTWTFGDGGKLVTSDAGSPYPNMTTTHTFTTTGRFGVTLSTTYAGRYRVAGSPEWLPVDGTVSVASPGRNVEVIEARAVLVP